MTYKSFEYVNYNLSNTYYNYTIYNSYAKSNNEYYTYYTHYI